MVKAYLKYQLRSSLGLVSSTNADFDISGRFAVTGCLEQLMTWNVKRGDAVSLFYCITRLGAFMLYTGNGWSC